MNKKVQMLTRRIAINLHIDQEMNRFAVLKKPEVTHPLKGFQTLHILKVARRDWCLYSKGSKSDSCIATKIHQKSWVNYEICKSKTITLHHNRKLTCRLNYDPQSTQVNNWKCQKSTHLNYVVSIHKWNYYLEISP